MGEPPCNGGGIDGDADLYLTPARPPPGNRLVRSGRHNHLPRPIAPSPTAPFRGSATAPVHLKVVLASSPAVSQRTPWPLRHPVSGPCRTSLVHRKPPADLTKPVAGSYEPPPVSVAAPVGNPLMPLALKPNPVWPPAAHAVGAIRTAAAASTAGTSAMDFTFIFQIFISRPPLTVRSPEEPVAHAEGDAAPGALAKSACEHPPPVAPRHPGPPACEATP